MATFSEHLFDKRIVQRHIKHQKISAEDYQKFLSDLPDVSDKSVPIFYEEPQPENKDEVDSEDEAEAEAKSEVEDS